jgi:hypothetical protein
MIPLASVPQAVFKLVVASFRHPNSDKEIIVREGRRVDVKSIRPPQDRPEATAR